MSGVNAGKVNTKQFLTRLRPEDRIKVQAHLAQVMKGDPRGADETSKTGWSIYTEPSTGEPYVVRLHYRGIDGKPLQVISIREDKKGPQ